MKFLAFTFLSVAFASNPNDDTTVTISPGVVNGDVITIPVHVPINLCGNTINVIGLLNPAFGNNCVNAFSSKKLELRGIGQARLAVKYSVNVTLDECNGVYVFEVPTGPLLDICGETPDNPVAAPVEIVCGLGQNVTIG